MGCTKRLLLLPGALLCASVAMADTAPTSLFQLNGFAGSPAQPGTGGSDPAVAATCTYLVGGNVTSGQVCDNWNLLNGSGIGSGSAGHSATRSFLPGSSSFLFKSGSKDINDINTWVYSPTQKAPPKATFTSGFAAAYSGPSDGHLVVEFGGDRGSENGTTDIGIWFFQQNIVPCPQPAGSSNASACTGIADGRFGGLHSDHDIFIWVEFTNGGGTSFVNVYEWDHTGCPTGSETGCAAQNLRLLGSETAGNLCGPTIQCGVVNSTTTHTSWEGDVVNPLFFEGGLDVTAALLKAGVANPPCFSSFQLETRASATINSELKAFLVGSFPVCSMSISKACNATADNPPTKVSHNGTTYVHYTFTGVIKNTGLGNIFNLSVDDTFPSTAFGGTTNVLNQPTTPSGGLAGGATAAYSGSFDVPTLGDVTNTVKGHAAPFLNGPPSVLDNSDPPKTATASAVFGPDAKNLDGTANTFCHQSTSPLLTLTKICQVDLVQGSSGVTLALDDTVTLCNTSPDNKTVISNIAVKNTVANASGSGDIDTGRTLQPGQCIQYLPADSQGNPIRTVPTSYLYKAIPFYTPTQCDGGSPTLQGGRCEFTDTVTYDSIPKDDFGQDVPIGDLTLPNGNNVATCHVCPFGACTLQGTP